MLPDPEFTARRERATRALRAQLGKTHLAALRTAGWALSIDDVIEEALALAPRLGTIRGHRTSRTLPRPGLSARELEVLHLIGTGRTNAEIAEALHLRPR